MHFLDDQNLLFCFSSKKLAAGEGEYGSHYKGYLGIISVTSPEAQVQDCKCFDFFNFPFSQNSSLIKKRLKEEIFESAPNDHKPVTTKVYYLGYNGSNYSKPSTFLIELKVTSCESKLSIIL